MCGIKALAVRNVDIIIKPTAWDAVGFIIIPMGIAKLFDVKVLTWNLP